MKATGKQKQLADIIKECHDGLRFKSKLLGPERAWEDHLNNKALLEDYANAMRELATIWEENTKNSSLLAQSRVQWTRDYCEKYFYTENILLKKRLRELRILEFHKRSCPSNYIFMERQESIKLLDVGSCFNPFQAEKYFQVTAIDLHPANESVLRGDFLRISVVDMLHPQVVYRNACVSELPSSYFECVVFSLLLEYIPDSSQRLLCCRKAYDLLKYEGVLIIITPDSQPVGKNAKLMKNWQYTLATLGFTRIHFEKLPHITCMVFRKACDPFLAYRWAELHREEYMTVSIDIPQDK